ncbi:MAG: GatB/YqeY domain-containing protein, partial [Ginsengibacter sp.]
IKAAIINLKTSEGFSGLIKEDDEIKLLQKLVKQRKESLEIYEKQNRTDLAEKEKEEISVIEKFLPKQMSEEDLKEVIASIVKQAGATSQADMGKVMGMANKQLAGRADGKTIATIVKEILASK